ncbi:MAG: hypothetical protein WCC94_03655 [Candidatus Bathyarchaeia archaeon]
MKPRLVAMAVMLVVIVLVICFPVTVMAQTHPTLQTDRPLYTLRDKQVVLQGAGYTPRTSYVIWVQTPRDNSTRKSGFGFTTTDKGEIPPAISLPIESVSPFGTYLVSISGPSGADAAIAQAHYGIWGTYKYVYQRTEVVQTKGGGLLPTASLKMTIRNPSDAFVFDTTIAANETGTFIASWKIPADAMTGAYTMFIDGAGTYDYPDKEFVSISKFSATPALLNVTILSQPLESYERMQTVPADFVVRYPDSTPVLTIKDGLKPVALYAGQFKISNLGLTPSGVTSGIWAAQSKIPRNATLDVKYRFLFQAKMFDDGNGNIGPEKDLETNDFNIVPATLRVTVTPNATHYQVPFDTLTAYTQVSYSDGTLISNATVRAWLSRGDWRVEPSVTPESTTGGWIIRYALSWGDLIRPGSWELRAEAGDIFGNTGSGSVEIIAEPYQLIQIIAGALAVVLVVRWLLSKFWRRLYLGAKRGMSAMRERLKPPSVGRYPNDSPVTP